MACWVLFWEERGGEGVQLTCYLFLDIISSGFSVGYAGYGRQAGQASSPAQLSSTSADNQAHNWPIFTR